MKKRVGIVVSILLAAYIGYGLYKFWDFKAHPGENSAPWYTSLVVYGVGVLIVLAASYIIRKKGKK